MTDRKPSVFNTDIDLRKNQIKNGTWEYWEGDTLPDETKAFDGQTIFLKNEITVGSGATAYIYEKGSVCVFNKSDTGTGGQWNKQLSSMQTDDIMAAIYDLWKSKSGNIHWAENHQKMMDWLAPATHENYYELDLVIVDVDETKNNCRTLYVGYGDGTGSVQAIRWDFVCIINDSPRKETALATGTSKISNEVGDAGARMMFVNTTGQIKSGVSVHDGSGTGLVAGTYAEMYAVNGSGNGTRILMQQDKAYYLGPGENTIEDKHEIATMEYVVMSASKCLGWVDDYAHLPTTGMNAADYVYVRNDEHELASRTGETIAPSTRYYRNADNTEWVYSCDVGNNGIRLLGVEEHSKQPYHIPFNINELVQEPTKISTTFDTITLDNKATKVTYPIEIPSADVTHDKAGLYNKTLADKKVNVSENMFVGEIKYKSKDADKIVFETPRRKLDLDQTIETTVPTFEIPKMDGANAGLYTKAMADVKLDTSASMVMTGLTTRNRKANVWEINTPRRRLDNSGATDGPVFTLGAMDPTNNLAGLYTKAMADSKLDILTDAPDGNAYKLPYYFEAVSDADKIRVKSHTITLDNKKTVDTTSYFIDVVGATFDKAGLMTAADKIKLDGLVIDEYSTPEATDKAMSVRLAMEKIKELGHDFVGAVETHADLATLEFKPGSMTKKIDVNDIAVVLDDSGYPGTPSHNKECWRYRCTDVSKLGTVDAWSPEYRVSNIPFTAKQWNAINSYEIEETNGFSYVSNLNGDAGALLKFVHNDGTKSAIAVNDGGANGVAAQIYAIGASATDGVKLNVRKSGLYYLKNKATPVTEDPDDEIAVKGDFANKLDKYTPTAGGTTDYVYMVDRNGVQGNKAIASQIDSDGLITGNLVKNYVDTQDTLFILKTSIINDFTTGGSTNVASAETVKTLNDNKVDKDGDKTLSKITLNGTVTQTPIIYAPTTVGLNGQFFGSDGTTTGWLSVTAVQRFKNPVATVADLPATGNEIGDCREVIATGDNWGWNGTEWKNMGKTVDLSAYQTKKVGSADVVLISNADAEISVSPVTSTELSYLSGVTSGIQAQIDGKIKKLPKETFSGLEYQFPFNINPLVQTATSITTSFDTLVLNDGTTRGHFDMAIPSADFSDATNPKAGLYTKALADAKSKVTVSATGTATDTIEYITVDNIEKKIMVTLVEVTNDEIDTMWS